MVEYNQYRKTLKDYAKKRLSGGDSIKQIKEKMLERGYPKQVVESILQEISSNHKLKIILYIAGIIVIAIIIISAYILITNNPSNLRAKVLAQTAEKELSLCRAGRYNRCLAIANKDASFCENIGEITISMNLKESCKEIVPLLIYYAGKTKEDKCKNITTNYFKSTKEETVNDCMEILNALDKNDINLCSKETCNFAYNIFKANNEKNIAICDEINETTAKTDCKMLFSSSTDYCDYSQCDKGKDKFISEGIKNS